ncbi:MAG: peroxiredoxin [Bacteroidota bacterium]|nr:peroxiredoxin [Bacteroidota bacterium]
MSLVGKKAPNFKATALVNGYEMVENFSLEQYLGKKYVCFFFYPKDFTFVCPTEIHAFQKLSSEFEKRNCAIVGCSTDTENSHLAWLTQPKNKGGIEGVKYPLVADTSKTIATNYGVLGGNYAYDDEGNMIFEGAPIAFRGTFLINKEGIVMHETINYFPIGRNVDETIRTLDAIIHHDKFGEVCPANWEEGGEAMKETVSSVSEYLAKH